MLHKWQQWYYRIGKPIEVYTSLSVKACRKILSDNSIAWTNRNPIGLTPYRLQWISDTEFMVRHRRRLSERPFMAVLQATPAGGTKLTGYFINDSSFLGFAGFIIFISPVAGGLVYGGNGLLGGLLISAAFIAAPIFVRIVEEQTQKPAPLRHWLQDILKAESKILDHSAKQLPPT